MLAVRALLSFLLLPGTFAVLIPAWIISADRWRGATFKTGIVPLVIGAAVLFWCVRDFYVSGKGTLAPWDPPKHLVIVGLYRFSRNPMYGGILLLLMGWSLWAGSLCLGIYSALLGLAFHVRVVGYEEPTLQRQFGAEWTRYFATVPRWIPSVRR